MEARIHGPALEDALERYMHFGGLPAAVAEAAAGLRSPSEALRRVLYDSLIREVQRRGAGVPATHALLERVIRSLGSKTDWSRMAREMDVPLSRRRGPTSHQTLRDYIELLADGYFLFIVYFWRASRRPTASRTTRRSSSPIRCCTRSRWSTSPEGAPMCRP